jgi:hypothetical protein
VRPKPELKVGVAFVRGGADSLERAISREACEHEACEDRAAAGSLAAIVPVERVSEQFAREGAQMRFASRTRGASREIFEPWRWEHRKAAKRRVGSHIATNASHQRAQMRIEQAPSHVPGARRGYRFRPVEIARPSRGIDQGDRGGGDFRRDINYARSELRNRTWRISGYPTQRDAREPQFAFF